MTNPPHGVEEIEIDPAVLTVVVKEMLQAPVVPPISWSCVPLGKYKEESGVFRVHYQAITAHNSQIACSLILKIIRPDVKRDEPRHYYYWKREALVYRSGILDRLPDTMRAPKCYAVEEQSDGTVWLWLEDVAIEPMEGEWTLQRQQTIAHLLGSFNGFYAAGAPLPADTSLCRQWMRSWVNVCTAYSKSTGEQKALWDQHLPQSADRNGLWDRYETNLTRIDSFLETLDLLPRVFAHQDVHWDNIFLDNSKSPASLVALDWQFASISGAGEELGRMFGYALLKKAIPVEQAEQYKEALFQSYLNGLREAGWQGSPIPVRYGFTLTAALRFVMVVDKLIRSFSNTNSSGNMEKRNHLLGVTRILLDLADEAWSLKPNLADLPERA